MKTGMNTKVRRAAGFSPRGSASAKTAEKPDQRLWDEARLATPHTQDDKAARVRSMFDQIAPTYERVNSIASAGRDRLWRRQTVRLADVRPTDCVLDVACGTGDLAEAFALAKPRVVVGLDFSRPMLVRSVGRPTVRSCSVQGDALRLPFADQSFDIACCGFGVRNFQKLQVGLAEMYRVLRPAGRAMILEFTMPNNPVFRKIYGFYFAKIMPVLANWISGDRTRAYDYLPRSVSTFVSPPQMIDMLTDAGFSKAGATRMTFGIVHIYRADKADTDSAI